MTGSHAMSQVVVSSAGRPLLDVGISNNTFSFSFQTQASHSNTIQARTNLVRGVWVDVTNSVGDGSIKQFGFSGTNPPFCFFRLLTKWGFAGRAWTTRGPAPARPLSRLLW